MARAKPDPAISPYAGLEDRAFWRPAVAEAETYPPPDLYRPKFPITRDMRIMTAGSCFAQHLGRTLVRAGFDVIDTERLPGFVPDDLAQRHGYRLYSARYGNIYTMRQWRQLLEEAQGIRDPGPVIWERDGRFYDALRPGVTPGGLAARDHVADARQAHIAALRNAIAAAEIVVFTMGLTEAWQDRETGTVFPTAPGTIAGRVDRTRHVFVNFRAREIMQDFLCIRDLFRAANADVKFLLTVSPVPLTATASGDHVLPATTYSKSVLRTVAGELAQDFADIDYFPSYEIVAAHPGAARFFAPDLRSVKPFGVRRVMQAFLSAHDADRPAAPDPRQRRRARRLAAEARLAADEDLQCEDALLEAFRK